MPLSSSLLAKKNTRHLLKKRPPKRLNGVNNVNCKFQENHLSIQCMQIRVHSRFEFKVPHSNLSTVAIRYQRTKKASGDRKLKFDQ